jgi:hypothetical protein
VEISEHTPSIALPSFGYMSFGANFVLVLLIAWEGKELRELIVKSLNIR